MPDRNVGCTRLVGQGALAVGLLALATTAWAGGGSWYRGSEDCSQGSGGGTYIGVCETGNSDAKNAAVTFDSDLRAADGVFGGAAEDGDATGNVVKMVGGEVSEGVAGGASQNGAANGNTVTISGGQISSYRFAPYTVVGASVEA